MRAETVSYRKELTMLVRGRDGGDEERGWGRGRGGGGQALSSSSKENTEAISAHRASLTDAGDSAP